MLYGILVTTMIAVGVLAFDEIFKPRDDYVGWAFLTGVGTLSLLFGIIFIFFPTYDLSHGLYLIRTRAFALILFGIIIIIESLLIRTEVVPSDTGVNSDTVGPILLKFASIFVIAWGVFHLSEYIVFFLGGLPITTNWQLLLSGSICILTGFVIIIYIETQKRQPRFRFRRLPLLMSFIMLLATLPLTTIYLRLPYTFILPIGLALSLMMVILSFYIVYHPISAR